MKKVFFALLLTALLWPLCLMAQMPVPAKAQDKPIVITNATIHVGDGNVLNNSSIRMEKGLITAISEIVNTDGATVIDASNQHVYPGFILMSSSMGLSEIDAVRASVDHTEVGQNNPNARALIAYNAESDIIPTTRNNGVLLSQITPRGYEGILGTSFVAQFDAWSWEDAIVRADEGLHITFPSSLRYSGDWTSGFTLVQNGQQGKQIQELEQLFTEAQKYTTVAPNPINLRFESMKGLFDGSKTLYVAASSAKDIVEAVTFAKRMGVKKTVLVGAQDAWRVATFLKENNLAVILEKAFSLPQRDDDDYDAPYKNAALLQKAGVRFSFAYSLDSEPHHARNLPFSVGMSVGYGLPYEAGIQALTLTAAQILGIDKKYGSLEIGKSATLFVSSGDALDMRSNQLSHAFIDGRTIDLQSKHTFLYERFKQKYNKK